MGCDISLNLMHNCQLTGGGGQGGQDFILKSSSDVKVGQSVYEFVENAEPSRINI